MLQVILVHPTIEMIEMTLQSLVDVVAMTVRDLVARWVVAEFDDSVDFARVIVDRVQVPNERWIEIEVNRAMEYRVTEGLRTPRVSFHVFPYSY